MNNDMLPCETRDLATIRKAWQAFFWISREEEAVLMKSRAKPPAAHSRKKPVQKKTPARPVAMKSTVRRK